MRAPKNTLYLLVASSCYLLSLVPNTYAYGEIGHTLTAQVAQKFLSPQTKAAIKKILPEWTKGNIDTIASWADKIKRQPEYRFASILHYINPPKDYPPSHCDFQWVPGHKDVVNAIYNYTQRLGDPTLDAHQHEDALKFLVHFIGDLHNPLHITGRERGGNDANAIFEGHRTKLHRIWDSQILNKQIRELDEPYINYVLNLLKTTWRPFIAEWVTCPSLSVTWTPDGLRPFMGDPDDIPACPDFWGAQINALNCEYVWRDYTPTTELSDGIYWNRIQENQVEERLIAMAGVRMAAVLNSVLGEGKEENTAKKMMEMMEVQEELSEAQIWMARWRKWVGTSKGRFSSQN